MPPYDYVIYFWVYYIEISKCFKLEEYERLKSEDVLARDW